jgi:hypothetical protein
MAKYCDRRPRPRSYETIHEKENYTMSKPKGSISKARSFDAGTLREILKPIHDKLSKAGVPEARMPSNEAIVSKLLSWLDQDKVAEWVKKYAETMN